MGLGSGGVWHVVPCAFKGTSGFNMSLVYVLQTDMDLCSPVDAVS